MVPDSNPGGRTWREEEDGPASCVLWSDLQKAIAVEAKAEGDGCEGFTRFSPQTSQCCLRTELAKTFDAQFLIGRARGRVASWSGGV